MQVTEQVKFMVVRAGNRLASSTAYFFLLSFLVFGSYLVVLRVVPGSVGSADL